MYLNIGYSAFNVKRLRLVGSLELHASLVCVWGALDGSFGVIFHIYILDEKSTNVHVYPYIS
jgi:hypothetical protein